MKLQKMEDVQKFLDAVEKCEGGVHLTSVYGDDFNLKSQLSTYLAVAALVGEHGDELELFCDNKDDEIIMLKFFAENPQYTGVE